MASKSAKRRTSLETPTKGKWPGCLTFDNFLQYLGMYLGAQLGLGQIEETGSGGHLYWEN